MVASASIENKLVSTIIPVHNRPKLILDAVRSVMDQTYRPIEIIIVDDGSTDGTEKIVDDLAVKYSDEIKVLHQDNGGPGRAREAGRIFVKGEYIQYLDSDDILLPNKFTDQVKALRENPDCGIAYGYTRLVDENNQILESPYKETGADHPYLFPRLLVQRWWNTHTPLFRREVCDRAGSWETMHMGEDWIYDARMGAMGIKLVNCHSFVAHTRQHKADRLTGGTLDRMKLADIATLILTLGSCAAEAEMPESAPEWDVFYRWAFLEMRRTAEAGLSLQSEKLFELLKTSSMAQIKTQAAAYRLIQRIIGPHRSNAVYNMASSLKNRIKVLVG